MRLSSFKLALFIFKISHNIAEANDTPSFKAKIKIK
jgi:hypothetical protein